MARRKNVVVVRVLDIGSQESIEQVIAENAAIAQELVHDFAPQVLEQTRRNIQTRVLKPMLMFLRLYPSRQLGMPIRWKTERQRKYVLALLRKQFKERHGRNPKEGESIAYQRTFKLRDGWEATAQIDKRKNSLKLTTENTAETADRRGRFVRFQRFVTGDIGLGESRQSIARYKAPQQPFHVDRGWALSAPIIQKFYRQAEEEAEALYFTTLERIIRKRKPSS